ncbi:hypothetical protein Skr01_56050 [Sphaerisporangium krabiense]|uniref:Tat pathway signal protein n=1 Tax=Sphaerisporangium krabiense TaxID=763782 RepID=A0A7W8ZB92_9ACTN|nr:hypothetical protein [Sphaerisporangium krabiense]MBB5630797.1 hypothetical protein [Sphaerisporangium krabiense]GII65520.1 hypothetical protein Skr01_56050 [Sphaerisporangium krabiense]
MRGARTAAALAAAAMIVVPASAEAAAAQAHVPAAAAAASPAKVANKLLRAWLRDDRAAAAAVASPAAVKTLFAYVYRAPDEFNGCAGNACRFTHTSVRVPGGLNGILMIVSGGKVAKVYESRHVTAPEKAAQYLFAAWKAGDRNRGLEIASTGAVKTLFRTRFGGAGYIFQGCQAERGGRSCAYSYEGGAMFLHLRGSKIRGYEVRSISYIAD